MTGWAERARCRREPGVVDFFSEDPTEEARAVVFCTSCPVRIECLAEALEVEAKQWMKDKVRPAGVYGGKTEQQREDLLHGRQ